MSKLAEDFSQNVAKLARIDVPQEKVAATQAHLEKVLNYVRQIESVEIPDDIEPFFGAIESVNALRSDQVHPSFSRDKILDNSPDSDGEFYKVPPVFDEKNS